MGFTDGLEMVVERGDNDQNDTEVSAAGIWMDAGPTETGSTGRGPGWRVLDAFIV